MARQQGAQPAPGGLRMDGFDEIIELGASAWADALPTTRACRAPLPCRPVRENLERAGNRRVHGCRKRAATARARARIGNRSAARRFVGAALVRLSGG